MYELNIKEFQGYDAKTIYQFLMIQNQNSYQIKIPKTKAAIKDPDFDVFWELHEVAYAGQRLNEISDEFAYYVPNAYKKRPFVFEIYTKDKEKLADLLFILIDVFLEEYPNEINEQFDEEASQFFCDAYDTELKVATWGLIELANDYLD